MARKTGTDTRLGFAAIVLAAGVFGAVGAAHLGAIDLGAGDIKISMARGESGILMDIAPRSCPPRCGFDLKWEPLMRRGQ